MSEPRILVLGAGSIGRRHAVNLLDLGAHVDLADADHQLAKMVERATPTRVDAVDFAVYDGVVVASPTAVHAEHTRLALSGRAKVLVEKPLAMTCPQASELARYAPDRIMVGYNLRFHQPVERFMELSRTGRAGEPMSVRAWFGSWLPAWRPTVDYRTTYSASAELGGGVLLDAIHELDLLIWLLGPDLAVQSAIVDRLGPLEIDTEDTVRALMRSPHGTVVELALDYLSRSYRRGLELIGTDATLRLDWATASLTIESEGDRQVETFAVPLDRSYEREAGCFLEWIAGRDAPPVDGATGTASLRLADDIRRRAGEGSQ